MGYSRNGEKCFFCGKGKFHYRRKQIMLECEGHKTSFPANGYFCGACGEGFLTVRSMMAFQRRALPFYRKYRKKR